MALAVLAKVALIREVVCLETDRGLRTGVRGATGRTPGGDSCHLAGRQTMDEDITAYVGLDVHKDSIAIATAPPGRAAPRFIGTAGPELKELLKALAHLGEPGRVLVAYEAGPCGYRLARQLGGHTAIP